MFLKRNLQFLTRAKKKYKKDLAFNLNLWYSRDMKITDIDINDNVTFKHGDNLEFVDTGVVFHIEDNCVHVEVKELDEVFEVVEEEILEAWF